MSERDQAPHEPARLTGELASAISNAVVHSVAALTGRGPTRARTTLAQDAVFVVLHDTLTRGEQTLVAAGETEAVLALRRSWQRVLGEDCTPEVERLIGRRVIGFMSDNHADPDIAVLVFIVEPVP